MKSRSEAHEIIYCVNRLQINTKDSDAIFMNVFDSRYAPMTLLRKVFLYKLEKKKSPLTAPQRGVMFPP